MIDITERQEKLLKTLESSGERRLTSGELAATLGVSERTVQSEISVLRKMGLVNSNNKGYALAADLPLKAIETQHTTDSRAILLKLLSSNDHIRIEDLADDLYLSESTLRGRLKDARALLEEKDLNLIVRGGEVYVTGTELNKRKMIRSMIFEDVNLGLQNLEQYQQYFPDINLSLLLSIVEDSIQAAGYGVQPVYASGLVISVSICLYRVTKDIHTPDDMQLEISVSEYELACKICDRFSRHFAGTPTEGDRNYIASLFHGQIRHGNLSEKSENPGSDFDREIEKMLNEVLEYYLISGDSAPYLQNLILHVHELLKRSDTNNYVVNTIHIDMRDNCPFIYEVAVRFAKELDSAFHISIPDDEISFLAVHIGLIIEESMKSDTSVLVLLYAPTYHEIAAKIEKTVEEAGGNNVQIEIVDPSVRSIPRRNYDLVVTTQDISFIGTQVIRVSPFLSVIDRSLINEAVTDCIRAKEHQRNYKSLVSSFIPELFFIDTSIHDRDEAIRFLSSKLYDLGIVDKNFESEVFEREKLSSTCFLNSFAIPHSMEMNANKTAFAILINREGIRWDSSVVKLCILVTIRSKDRSSFAKVYEGVISTLMDSQRLNKLVNSSSLYEFVEIFKGSI